jgi:2-alkyl-3-oxoalkanoate reductase
MFAVKVAVVGGSGFVGGHAVRFLREAGHEVRAVVRNSARAPIDCPWRVADVQDVYALRDAFGGCDYVVHAALGPPEVIVGCLAPIYAAAQAVGIRRIVYISTGSVHGQAPKPGTDETSRLTVVQPFAYNTAKVRAERRLRRLRARGTVELVMLRPTIVFGPGSRWIFDFAFALRDGSAYVVDGARGICNSIYVDNLAHAIGLALSVPGIDGEVFHVGDAETVTWRDLYAPIASEFGFDLNTVPSFSPPVLKAGFKQLYLEPIRSSDWGQVVLRHVPASLKDALRAAARLARPRPQIVVGPGSSQPSGTRGPDITAEMIALHRCAWRFPQDKARRLLGYVPPVSFREGCRRSVEWLQPAFARSTSTIAGG